tara:strand:- start:2106 stop:2522 length:417 start_codon:yes stop_codon:yes gene_type:complete
MSKHTWIKKIIHSIPVLAPNCVDAVEWLKKTKLDQGVLIDPRRPRNIKHHRKLFALLNLAVDNWPVDITTHALLGLIKIRTGHADPVESAEGVVWIPRSINFESMDQTEFDPFYEKAIQLIALALGVDVADLEREAVE